MTAPVPPAPSGPASNATLAEVGLQATYLDRSVDPCVDFVQFACGGWLATTQIPADQPAWSTASEAAEKNRAALKALLEQATGKVGDYYAACTDEAAIEKAGLAPLKPLLDRMMKVNDAKSWLAALTAMHDVAIWAGFSVAVRPDAAGINTVTLGLPRFWLGEPAAYLAPDRKELRDAYEQHVARMLALAGMPKPERAAADVIAIEIELAKLADAPQGPAASLDLKALAKQTKSIDWKAYAKALGIPPATKLLVVAPKYVAGLDGVRKRFKPAQWAGYFTYQLVADMAFALPNAFNDEAFTLDQKVHGTAEKPPRWARCVRNTAWELRDLVDQAYVAKAFPAEARAHATTLVDAVVVAVRDDAGSVEWASEAARQSAVERITKLARVVGYPDGWQSYDFAVKRDDLVGNVLRGVTFKVHQLLAQVGKPATPRELAEASATAAQPAYKPTAGVLVVPAAFLQPPFFSASRSTAANLGGMGATVGATLVRGITETLPAEDRAKRDAKAECIAQQYGTFEAAPKQFIDGKRTLDSSVADLAGVKLAFRAYRTLRKSAAQPIIADGFTEDQQFFLGVAQAACSKARPAELQRLLTSSAEAPPKFRIYGALRNLPEFAQAFSCAAGTPMHPAQTCSVW